MEFKVARLNFRNVSSARWLLTITISASPLTSKVIIEINIAIENRDYSKGEFFLQFFARSVKGTKTLCISFDMTVCIKVLKISVLLK